MAGNIEDGNEIEKLNLRWKNGTVIQVFHSDITKLQVDAIVTSTNDELGHSAGLAGAIGKVAGPELQKVCDSRIKKDGKLKVTQVYVTQGYKLPCKYIIHTMGPQWRSEDNRAVCEKLLYQTIINCLQEAEKKGIQTIAIPAISHGIFGVPLPIVVKQLYQAITDHLEKSKHASFNTISIVDINTDFLTQMQRELTSQADGTSLSLAADDGTGSDGDVSDEEQDDEDDTAVGRRALSGVSTLDDLNNLLVASLLHGFVKRSDLMGKSEVIECPYWKLCREYVEVLDVGVYLEPHFDLCFCDTCIQKRGDDHYYERGDPKETYALPIDWARFGLKTHAKCRDRKLDIFNKWHVAFHGTSPHNVTGILQTGGELLMPGDTTMDGKKIEPPPGHFTDKRRPAGFDVQQIFTSPTIKYAGHEAYARPIQWTDGDGQKRKVKIVFQLRIKPDSYTVGKQTTDSTLTDAIDPKFDNAKLEWSTKNRGATVVTGLLVQIE